MKFEKEDITALLDTGSVVTTISDYYYKTMKNRPELHSMDKFGIRVTAANGGFLPYTGYIEAEIEVENVPEPITTLVLVTPPTPFNIRVPLLIGTNVIREVRRKVEEEEVSEEWQTAISFMSCNIGIVTNTKEITLKPNETRTIVGFVRKRENVDTVVTEKLEEEQNHNALICPRVVTLNKPGNTARIPVRICNLSSKPMKFKHKQPICQLQEVKIIRGVETEGEDSYMCSPIIQDNSDRSEEDKSKKAFQLDTNNLTEEETDKAIQILDKWKKLIPTSATDLGHTSKVKHKIELTDDRPIKQPYRRIPPGVFTEVKEHLQEMLSIGAIRPSTSPWSSNVVIVRKKDGTIRFCIDFRKLNAKTKKDAYGIPKIDDTLHLLSGAKYFSKLDLKSGYWQVELEEKDKEKTAFQVPGLGFWECTVMPFGLTNAPATFQRLMERCMGDINLQDCLIYLDDIIIFSKTIEEHIERLDKVFQRLDDFNLKVNPKKCEFFKTSITYLGHIVSNDGIHADPDKIDAVVNWPVPKTVKQVRQFLGFAGYYRRFIEGFAKIARPLNDLLIGHPTKKQNNKSGQSKKPSKRTPFVWHQPQEEAFHSLKTKLTQAPILGYADYTKSFRVHTDASTKGLGAVLYQRQDGQDRVIAYASRSLKPSEKSYPAHKLEFLALKWSVTEKYHDYLYGGQFEVITDNNPLTYVTTTAKLDATGQRWLAALSNYNFNIRYRSGKQNADADGLSRIPTTEMIDAATIHSINTYNSSPVESTPICFSTTMPEELEHIEHVEEVPEDIIKDYALSSKDWRSAQLDDPILHQIHDHFRQGTRPSVTPGTDNLPVIEKYRREWDKIQLKDGVLYRQGSFNDVAYLQLILPETLRDDVFKALHDDLGYQGRDRTISLFKQRFFWPGMDSYVRNKVINCGRCIRRKQPIQTCPLVNIKTTAPMELICIDFLSLEQSKGGIENILVVTDHFTRYAQAFPTTSQTAKTTAKVLFDKFIVHYGFPERIHSDQGANFTSNLIKEMCHLADIKQSRTTPYHPMGNGMVERFNQTLLKMMGTLDNNRKSDWKTYVAPLTHAYNVTIHTSTGFAPYFLMFGRHPKLAIDSLLGIHLENFGSKYSHEYARKLKTRLSEAYKKATEITEKAAEKSKLNYDKKAKYSKLQPGDIVLVRNVTIRGKRKIADKWEEEPYIVIAQPNKDTPVYEVKKNTTSTKKTKRLHRNLLLPLSQTNDVHIDSPDNSKKGKYIIPQRRQNSVASESDDDDDSDSEKRPSRPTRIRRQPERLMM